jgi:lysozyme family protein
MPTYEQTRAGYESMWARAKILPKHLTAVERIAHNILKHKTRYQQIEALTGVPWFLVGALHSRESSLNFNCVLHNGERILGTGKKTKLVPKGRGPFTTFEEAAVDALTMKPHALNQIKEWPVSRILFEAERYNGFGYLGKTNSPYVWSFTDLYASGNYRAGKYVADGKWDASAVDQQCGVAAILKQLATFDESVAVRLDGIDIPPPPDIPKPEPKRERSWLDALLSIFKRN